MAENERSPLIDPRQGTPEQVPSDRTLERFGLTRVPDYVVEIGFGENPVPLVGNLRFGQYHGFDEMDESKNATYARILKGFREEAELIRPGENICLGYGDAVRDEAQGRKGIPLPEGVANEVIMADVLNTRFENVEKDEDKERRAILDEARRILALEGKLVIKTSWSNDSEKEFPLDSLRQLLANAGFSVVASCGSSQPEFDELEARYGRISKLNKFFDILAEEDGKTADDEKDDAYFVVAKKADIISDDSLEDNSDS